MLIDKIQINNSEKKEYKYKENLIDFMTVAH